MEKHCDCEHSQYGTLYDQSLPELEFQRGIWQAAIDNNISKVKQLLLKGVNVNCRDSSGYTALHYASRNNFFDMVKMLIDNGACVNCITKAGGDSPLHRSAYMGNLEITKFLVKNGASIELQNKDGQTCLHKAVQQNNIEVVKYLVSIKSNIKNIVDNKGKTPEMYYVSEEMLKVLIN